MPPRSLERCLWAGWHPLQRGLNESIVALRTSSGAFAVSVYCFVMKRSRLKRLVLPPFVRNTAGEAAAAAPDTDQHSEEANGDNNNTTPLPTPGDEEGGVYSGDVGQADEGIGDEGGDDEFPPEGRYRFYILSQEEAAAESSNAAAAAGSTASGPGAGGAGGGSGGGRLKGRYNFVIIGEGTAADAAVESILRVQPEAEILCLSDETVKIFF